jgi:hypothetical protein
MIRAELKQLKTGPKDLRKFGVAVGTVFSLLSLWFWWRHTAFWRWFLVPAVPLLLLGLAYPKSLRQVYLGWMAGALVLGFVVSNVLLIIFFYLVVTPTGLLARIFGKDFLSLKPDPSAQSYWLLRDRSVRKSKSDHEQQF